MSTRTSGRWTIGSLAGARETVARGEDTRALEAKSASSRRASATSSLTGDVRVALSEDPPARYRDTSPERMRHVMSSFGSGVTVVTALTDTGPAGFTCQSFTSLSLEPALVSFNPTRTSTSWPRIRAAGRFCINVLGADQEHVARAFSQPAGPSGGAEKFTSATHHISPAGTPRLDDAIAWIECTMYAEYDGGDHTIVAARVEGMSSKTAAPLLYFRGEYGTVAHH